MRLTWSTRSTSIRRASMSRDLAIMGSMGRMRFVFEAVRLHASSERLQKEIYFVMFFFLTGTCFCSDSAARKITSERMCVSSSNGRLAFNRSSAATTSGRQLYDRRLPPAATSLSTKLLPRSVDVGASPGACFRGLPTGGLFIL